MFCSRKCFQNVHHHTHAPAHWDSWWSTETKCSTNNIPCEPRGAANKAAHQGHCRAQPASEETRSQRLVRNAKCRQRGGGSALQEKRQPVCPAEGKACSQSQCGSGGDLIFGLELSSHGSSGQDSLDISWTPFWFSSRQFSLLYYCQGYLPNRQSWSHHHSLV